jgi:bacillolysin
MKNIVYLLLLSVTSWAQIKKVHTDPNLVIDKSKISLTLNKEGQSSTDVRTSDYSTRLHSGIKPSYMGDSKLPSYFSGKIDGIMAKGLSKENKASLYLDMVAPMMLTQMDGWGFVPREKSTDDTGMDHYRYQQVVNGVPIYGAEVILHGRDGEWDFLNGTYHAATDIASTTPELDQSDAMTACIIKRGPVTNPQAFMGTLFKDKLNDRSELVLYPHDGIMSLAYHITTYKSLVDRWEYFVDAQSGEVIHSYQSLCKLHNHKPGQACQPETPDAVVMDGKATANAVDLFNISRAINTYQVGSNYFMIDAARTMFNGAQSQMPDDPVGAIFTIDAFNSSPQRDDFKYDQVKSSNNTWSSKTSVSAHYNGGKSYEYFLNTHGRNSIDGAGGTIVSLINVTDEDDQSMGNAFWNGAAIFYGNGDSSFQPLARGLDVAGHEMSHGVVQATANLVYQGEAGALNESFADVFGVMIDRDDWKIGEDVVKTAAFPSGALRDMENPANGAPSGRFDLGWQPSKYSERYKGNEDNGGVHINSGIPNKAFYLLATAIGKDKAEKIYYRALSNYLTKSSQFKDCRVAVVKAATDLYSAAEVQAARSAFDAVEIFGENGGNYENDNDVNPGTEFILMTDVNHDGLYIHDKAGTNLGKISNTGVLSKPSITDNGAEIVFIGKDKKMHYITIDWTANPVMPQESIIEPNPIWRNAIISKDGLKIAAITQQEQPEIEVFYFGGSSTINNTFTLYNPTYTDGVATGDVNYADAMEFDITGEYIMYDAENQINGTSGNITYWDISFIKVWNNAANTWSLGKVEKLYSSLPHDVSVGNPTFAKNSAYLIAFDYIENGEVSIYAANIERGDASVVYENGDLLGYPNYFNDDKNLLFDGESNTGSRVIGNQKLKNKIQPDGNAVVLTSNRSWAVAFKNGKRNLSDITDLIPQLGSFTLYGNPVTDLLLASIEVKDKIDGIMTITDINGKILHTESISYKAGMEQISIPVAHHAAGMYILSIQSGDGINAVKYIKQ